VSAEARKVGTPAIEASIRFVVVVVYVVAIAYSSQVRTPDQAAQIGTDQRPSFIYREI
jgi:hypothetical protein